MDPFGVVVVVVVVVVDFGEALERDRGVDFALLLDVVAFSSNNGGVCSTCPAT